MATLPFDFLQFESESGQLLGRARLVDNGLEWPPPETIATPQGVFTQVSRSQLTDEVADHPNLARGALYRPAEAA